MEFLRIPKLFASTFYAVPDYQRDYEWTNTQNATLLDDVFSLFDSDEGNHFFCAIVTIPYEKSNGSNKSIQFEDYRITDERNVKHIVDGQQRLTSFSILARAICDLIVDFCKEDSTFVDSQKKKLEQIYFSNYYKGVNFAPYLILNGNTGYCYNHEILKMSSQKYNKLYKGAKRILAAYNFFRSEILKKYGVLYNDEFHQKEFYDDLVETLLNKVTIVEISCDASSDAFQVFDSLNGKGLDLTAADRIKNILMSWSPSHSRNQIWDNFAQKVGEEYLAGFFVSSFFYEKGKRISKNKLPDEFKNTYKCKAEKQFDSFISKLYDQGDIYGKLRSCSIGNTKLNEALQNLKNLKMEQIYVMLFAVILNYGVEIVAQKDFLSVVKMLTCLVVRMQVCERNMNRLDFYFSNWIEKMKKCGMTISDLLKEISKEMKTIVTDENFKQAFSRFAPKDNKISEYYLIQLEMYLRRKGKGNRDSVDKAGLSVEHVIPQAYSFKDWYGSDDVVPAEIVDTFSTDVVESIGNKALMYGDDNSAANNSNYETKLKIYQVGKKTQSDGNPKSTFCLIEELVKDYPEKFNHEQVFERAKKLAEYAVVIW